MDTHLPAGALAEALRASAARSSPADALAGVVSMAVASGPCDAASITVRTGSEMESVACSDDLTRKADSLQYDLCEGPCLDAVWNDDVYVINDLRADGRWPRWTTAAAGLGVGSSLSVHLFTDSALGSLNLYSLHPRQYNPVEVEAAKILAAHASVVLGFTRTEQHLWRAINARNLIGQAQGILMHKYGLTADKAFGVLRRYSQTKNIKLAEVAQHLTTTGDLPDFDAHLIKDTGH